MEEGGGNYRCMARTWLDGRFLGAVWEVSGWGARCMASGRLGGRFLEREREAFRWEWTRER